VGIFSRIGKKAEEALDKAIDPAKEVDMAILELEQQHKAAIAELVSYKATAKQLDADIERYKAKAVEWERRAVVAVKAGDDEAAKVALREQKACLQEAAKIKADRDEATGYAVQLNKSRKVFETKLQMLKLRKGTLATQIAAARGGGDVFGNTSAVWDKFQAAEDRIDEQSAEAEADAAMRGDDAGSETDLDRRLVAAASASGVPMLGAGAAVSPATDDALAAMKARVAADRAARQRALGSGGAPAAAAPRQDKPKGGAGGADGT
jgi:phage shock protein A